MLAHCWKLPQLHFPQNLTACDCGFRPNRVLNLFLYEKYRHLVLVNPIILNFSAPMDTLSNRGLGAVKPMLPYLKQFLDGLRDLHDPITNPDGYVLLAVAENRLSCGFADLMVPKLRDAATDAITASTGAYGDFSGAPQFREAFTAVCRKTFLKTLPASSVSPDDLIVSSGCGSVINNLCMSLLEPGDGVMLPTPTYAALPNDVGVLAKGVIVKVPTEGTSFRLTRAALDSAYEAGLASGHRPRMLLLLHPNNPLGTVYSRAELEMAVDWCLEKGRRGLCSAGVGCCGAICSVTGGPAEGGGGGAGGAARAPGRCPFAGAGALHLVVDEIYANSMHPSSGVRFESIIEVMHDRATTAPAAGSSSAVGGASGSAACRSSAAGAPGGAAGGEPAHAAACGAAVAESGGSDVVAASHASEVSTQLPSAPAATAAAPAGAAGSLRFLGNHVHAIWGLSKDWAMSGYRVGMLLTHNSALKAAVGGINYFSGVSGDTLDRLAAVMRDGDWCERYLASNAAALGSACELVCGLLREGGIPYTPPVAGMFVWADLRRYLAGAAKAAAAAASAAASAAAVPTGWAAERALTTLLYDRAKVLLTPGEACLAAEPGFYRICFAWMPEESVRAGFSRLMRVLSELEGA